MDRRLPVTIIKFLMILLESLHFLVDWRRKEKFDENVANIKADPVAFAKSKYGRVRDDDSKTDLPGDPPNTGGK